jgi:uncharacterized membrane protein
MKEKILKVFKQKSLTTNQVVLSVMFLSAILLSFKNGGLFLKELLLLGIIVLLAILGAQSKNQNNRH